MPSGTASPIASSSSKAILFATVPADRQFDYIVSNPPYVSTAEMANLAPTSATTNRTSHCDAGEGGTDVIAPLIEQAAARLKPGGALLIEISPMIAAEVEQLIRNTPALEARPNNPRPGRPPARRSGDT